MNQTLTLDRSDIEFAGKETCAAVLRCYAVHTAHERTSASFQKLNAKASLANLHVKAVGGCSSRSSPDQVNR